ncbi:hypothetical protein ACLI07_23095 (plasmid) [Providencia huaxiensis]|nr:MULTISPECIES: hypothetical protein [Enterobacterales]ELB1214876.1 hypothetical protein [Proteus mirabilis]ELY4881518.1 hypothetical protein [Morganella morganii]SPY66537.1 Uncharacterised protein [Providencia stuartii]ELR5094317.1 hypothetical protein [Providencia rettgeri]ELR5280641.1 hypothetical protein [Providencia rettgeri]
MMPIKMSFITCAFLLIGGCAAQPEQSDTTDNVALNDKTRQVNAVETPTKSPTAMQILKSSGLMPDDNYVSADFIPNSDNTMIVADIRDVPCKMIFRYITTTNGDYWMPNQIGCSP